MINTILTKISGLFSKDFLFASVLPTLIAITSVAAVLGAVFGYRYSLTAFDSLSTSQKAALTTGLSLTVVVVSYLLSAMRSGLIRAWSGDSPLVNLLFLAPLRWMVFEEEQRYKAQRRGSNAHSHWLDVAETLRVKAKESWPKSSKFPDFIVLACIHVRIALGLRRSMNEAAATKAVTNICACFAACSGTALSPVYQKLKLRLLDWHEQERERLQLAAATLDREFGGIGTIKPTRLGNVIQAYNRYAFKRYEIDTQAFWPALTSVIPENYRSELDESKTILDFAMAVATINVLFAFSSITLGPWLWYNPILWVALTVSQIISATFFYTLSVNAATQYGDRIRGAFDIYRLDLLSALQYERPKTLKDERALWRKVSQLVIYGHVGDLSIRAKPSDAG